MALGTDPDDLEPFVLARAAWTASFCALLWWAGDGQGDPRDVARRALGLLGLEGRAPGSAPGDGG